jgi:hypothetical protein
MAVRNFRVAGATVAALGIVTLLTPWGCQYAVTRLSTHPASWSYVEDGWGGIALAESRVDGDLLALTFRTHVHEPKLMDSGICICGTRARLDGTRVLVRLGKCVCGPAADNSLRTVIRKPKPGAYDVVYDDSGS